MSERGSAERFVLPAKRVTVTVTITVAVGAECALCVVHVARDTARFLWAVTNKLRLVLFCFQIIRKFTKKLCSVPGANMYKK